MTLEEIKTKIETDPNSIDWSSLSQYRALDQEFIEANSDKLDWDCICQYQTLDPDLFIIPHKDEVNWSKICRYQKLSSDWLLSLPDEILDHINFNMISETQTLSKAFINKFQSVLNWNKISIYQDLDANSLNTYYNKLDKREISRYQDLSESFINQHKDDLYWPYICEYQELSESFINTHLSYIDWDTLNIDKFTSNLSDSFVLAHINDIGTRRALVERKFSINALEQLVNTVTTVLNQNNDVITRYQNLTGAFIDKHDKYIIGNHNDKFLNWKNISYYQGLSEAFMNSHKDKLYWKYISSQQVCGQVFIKENRDKVDWKAIITDQPNSVNESFLMQFMDIELNRASFDLISHYVALQESTLMANFNYIGWENIARYQYLSTNFINDHSDMLRRPKTICIDRDIKPIGSYWFINQDYIEDLLDDYNLYQDINYNDFVRWHHIHKQMKALNSFWDAYDHYMKEKDSGERLDNDYTHNIKKYRHFDWLM